MPPATPDGTKVETNISSQAPIITTLYDLIAALNEEVEPGEEDAVTAAVVHLCHTGRLKFFGDPRRVEIDCT